jgi:hypothetical protein
VLLLPPNKHAFTAKAVRADYKYKYGSFWFLGFINQFIEMFDELNNFKN